MRIEQLQAFLTVAETGNFGMAARRCGVTQSTISRQIQSLEEMLGLSLFHRSSQARLTVGGEMLLPHARKICKEWDTTLESFRSFKAGEQPELCVAAIHSVCAYYLPPVLQQFCLDYPLVQLRVTALGSDRAIKVLKDGLVDLALVMDNPFLTTSGEMVVDYLYRERIGILMAVEHPLTAYTKVPPEKLLQYPQVVFKDGYGMQRLVQNWFQRWDVNLKIVMELNNLDAFRGVVRQGTIVALLPESALNDSMTDSTLAIRFLAPEPDLPELYRDVVMVTTKDRLEIPPIAHFRKLVQKLNSI